MSTNYQKIVSSCPRCGDTLPQPVNLWTPAEYVVGRDKFNKPIMASRGMHCKLSRGFCKPCKKIFDTVYHSHRIGRWIEATGYHQLQEEIKSGHKERITNPEHRYPDGRLRILGGNTYRGIEPDLGVPETDERYEE